MSNNDAKYCLNALYHYCKYFIFFGFGDFNDCMVKEFCFGKEKMRNWVILMRKVFNNFQRFVIRKFLKSYALVSINILFFACIHYASIDMTSMITKFPISSLTKCREAYHLVASVSIYFCWDNDFYVRKIINHIYLY